jgi:hypothetical protein
MKTTQNKPLLIIARSNYFELELLSNEKKQFQHLKLILKVYHSFANDIVEKTYRCKRQWKMKTKIVKYWKKNSYLKVQIVSENGIN